MAKAQGFDNKSAIQMANLLVKVDDKVLARTRGRMKGMANVVGRHSKARRAAVEQWLLDNGFENYHSDWYTEHFYQVQQGKRFRLGKFDIGICQHGKYLDITVNDQKVLHQPLWQPYYPVEG